MFRPLKESARFPRNSEVSFVLFYFVLFLGYMPLPEIKPATQVCALNRNQTGDPLVHRTTFNQLSHHQPGPDVSL